ncbi:aldo/keto reductase [Dysosmobacter welbionis]|uniref:aldo/keto reductase n=1 Tax=Dysosmobacter welbionis TaxID=2093857 RepID=UPI0032C1108A
MTTTITLNNGIEMPVLGIGTYILSSSAAENSVYWALQEGYRLIDTACIYGNEQGVGRAIRRAISEGIAARDEIFVTTKMWTADFDHGDAAINASLKKLGLDYIDLMILHHSQPRNDVKAYQAMEKAVQDGRLRAVGLSNYYTPEDFDRLVRQINIRPVLLQNETQPYYQSRRMKEHIRQYGTVLESWYPFGGADNTMFGNTKNKETLFADPVISSIAKANGKTPAQILLRWQLQTGNVVIPGSSKEAHIRENYEVFGFTLSHDEMEQIDALDHNERFSSY